jgi:phenylalanyl-tRNA synthetase beta chain
MRISFRWLQQYLGVRAPVEEVMQALTMGGIEVERYLDLGYPSKGIVIGKMLEIKKHPSADNLVLCSVDTGAGEPLRIVCGARNMREGDKVPVAVHGARLPNGQTIRRTRIRGEESQGMLCSGAELEWNGDASGILILPEEFPVGEPFDCLLEVKVTPNRPDCLSVYGIARDLAAIFGKKVSPPTPRFRESLERIEEMAKVTVRAKEACPRYAARVVRDVRIQPSPLWLQRALESAGLRPINNVVDVTNYVLLELGHPLHAFDLDKIASHHVIVRKAKDGEVIETLDGSQLKLTSADLLITDPAKPIALAGIMGGQNTEVSDSTINVLIECAYFDPVTIRRTSKRLDKQTDSSYRFERGTDRENLLLPLNRATQLIAELAGGQVAKGSIDVAQTLHPRDPIVVNIRRVNKVLGLDLSGSEIADKLVRLGFEIRSSDREQMRVAVPSYRVDVEEEIDLIEEVARIYGYDKIPETLPYAPARPREVSTREQVETALRNLLVSVGFCEVINYSFVGKDQVSSLGLPVEECITVLNPLSQEQSIMRGSLLPGIISSVQFNLNHGVSDIRIFEIGSTYARAEGETKSREDLWLAVCMCGALLDHWSMPRRECDFYDIKGIAERISQQFGIAKYSIEPANDVHYLHPGRSARFVLDGVTMCHFGELNPVLQAKLDLRERIYLLEMNVEQALPLMDLSRTFKEIPRFPSVVRDLAIIVDEAVSAGDIERAIYEAAKGALEDLRLFDLYKGEQVPQGKKSLAYSLTYRATDRTLTDDEVNHCQEAVVRCLQEKFGATLR